MTGARRAPAFLLDFLAAYLRARAPRLEVIVQLWPGEADLLAPVADALHPRCAIAVDPSVPAIGGVDDEAWPLPPEAPRPDAVLGVPPWRWQPRPVRVPGPEGDILLLDDPFNAAILRACTRLAEGGVGLFVVAPGFVLRPGPRTAFPAVRRLGLALQALITLPRGAFQPDTGSGRFLVALAPGPARAPVAGILTPDPASAAQLLRGPGGG